MGKICAFFGHREARLSNTEIQKLKETIRDLVCNYDVDTFWSGGYSNFDSDAVNIVEELKKDFPHLVVDRIIPYMPSPNQKEHIDYLKHYFDHVILPEEADVGIKKFAINRRNHYMAVNADFVVCYIRYEFGGAYNAVKSALKKQKMLSILSIKQIF